MIFSKCCLKLVHSVSLTTEIACRQRRSLVLTLGEPVLSNLAKNRTTEKDIRAWLNANGFDGRLAEITDVELHAVQRPGWLQIFRFHLSVRSSDDNDQRNKREYFGVVRDDERIRGKDKTQVQLFDSAELQAAELSVLSEELIVRGDRPGGYLAFLFLFGILLLVCTAVLFQLLQ